MKPIKCPKCNAVQEEINNAEDMCELLGLDASERENKTWWCGKCSYFFNDDEAEFEIDEYDLKNMRLSQISDLIYRNWNNMPLNAYRYVEAMFQLDNINESFNNETGVEIISYFLANAKSWQGDVAKDVKQYLNNLIKNNGKMEEQSKVQESHQAKNNPPPITKCIKCSAEFFAFHKNFRCPNCNELTRDFFDYIPYLMDIMQRNKQKHGKYKIKDDYDNHSEYLEKHIFDILDILEQNKYDDPEDFIKWALKKDNWKNHDYLREHIQAITLIIAKQLQWQGEDIEVEKLMKAKTGQPLEFTGYEVVDKNGNGTGRFFARKEDAEEYQKALWGIDKN